MINKSKEEQKLNQAIDNYFKKNKITKPANFKPEYKLAANPPWVKFKINNKDNVEYSLAVYEHKEHGAYIAVDKKYYDTTKEKKEELLTIAEIFYDKSKKAIGNLKISQNGKIRLIKIDNYDHNQDYTKMPSIKGTLKENNQNVVVTKDKDGKYKIAIPTSAPKPMPSATHKPKQAVRETSSTKLTNESSSFFNFGYIKSATEQLATSLTGTAKGAMNYAVNKMLDADTRFAMAKVNAITTTLSEYETIADFNKFINLTEQIAVLQEANTMSVKKLNEEELLHALIKLRDVIDAIKKVQSSAENFSNLYQDLSAIYESSLVILDKFSPFLEGVFLLYSSDITSTGATGLEKLLNQAQQFAPENQSISFVKDKMMGPIKMAAFAASAPVLSGMVAGASLAGAALSFAKGDLTLDKISGMRKIISLINEIGTLTAKDKEYIATDRDQLRERWRKFYTDVTSVKLINDLTYIHSKDGEDKLSFKVDNYNYVLTKSSLQKVSDNGSTIINEIAEEKANNGFLVLKNDKHVECQLKIKDYNKFTNYDAQNSIDIVHNNKIYKISKMNNIWVMPDKLKIDLSQTDWSQMLSSELFNKISNKLSRSYELSKKIGNTLSKLANENLNGKATDPKNSRVSNDTDLYKSLKNIQDNSKKINIATDKMGVNDVAGLLEIIRDVLIVKKICGEKSEKYLSLFADIMELLELINYFSMASITKDASAELIKKLGGYVDMNSAFKQLITFSLTKTTSNKEILAVINDIQKLISNDEKERTKIKNNKSNA